MKLKSLILAMFLIISATLTSSVSSILNSIDANNDIHLDEGDVKENAETSTDVVVTMRDIADFLSTKKEHYPLSDEFIERYQQKSGGYIEKATKEGMVVDKLLHEPNQKWHFFDSWLYPSIEESTLTWDESAENRVYKKLLCPELLLWIYEACEVDPVKVKAVKTIAEKAKVDGTHISTMASQMRGVVSWDDLKPAIVSFMNNNIEPYNVTIKTGEGFVVSGLEKQYKAGSKVTFSVNVTDSSKTISLVKANDEVLTSNSATYSFIMPSRDVEISILLKDLIKATSVSLSEGIIIKRGKTEVVSAIVEPSNTTDIASWSVVEGESLITITPNGNSVSIKALKEGKAKIEVSYNENVKAECEVVIEPSDVLVSEGSLGLYNIKYDMGSKTTSVRLNAAGDIFNTFELNENGKEVISEVSAFDYIYGGAYGGTNAAGNRWYTGDILKFGTTSQNGTLTLNLNYEVNQVKITGYVNATSCKLRVGDADSTDWTGTSDNKTILHTCSDMNITTKETVEANDTSTITLSFESTSKLRIATVTSSPKPFYITSIEFIYNA